jgi:glutaredoxin
VAYRDVENEKAAMAEMMKVSDGGRDVPVILEEGKVTIGYGGS